ncbi:hypothetical protein NL676_016156 [Syzygium grande]|nr:hypothetical protein NL676_016156 [Syzygium grande]
MHSLKVSVRARRSLHKLGSSPHQRSLSAQSHNITLASTTSKTRSLSPSLSGFQFVHPMQLVLVARLKRLYEWWEENPNVGFVSIKGSGKAFCSGGDVVTLYHLLTEGNIEECKTFFDTLYKFIYVQGMYLKPHLAILDGVTMASGAGISLPGMF